MEKINPKILDLNKSKQQDLRSVQVSRIIKSTGLVETKWFPYHAKAIKELGATKYLELSDIAKTGGNPPSLFSWLLKKELER